ncbi:MAG: type 4a pilus biogenesis protein PilO [Armatimonadota bacterium]
MAAFNLKASAKAVTVLIVISIVMLFVTVLVYLALAGRLKTAVSEMEAKAKRVEENRTIANRLEAKKLEYFDARSQVRFLEASVSTQEFIPTLLKQIEQLGMSVKLSVLGVRPSQETKPDTTKRSSSSSEKASEGNLESASESKSSSGGGTGSVRKSKPYDELQIELQVEGHYMSLLEFLYRLTQFPKIVAVDSVEITPISNKDQTLGSPRLNMKLRLTAFILKDQDSDDKRKTPQAGGIRATTPSDRAQTAGVKEVAGL